MKEERLAELIGEVREDFVQAARPPLRRKRPWRAVLALAACLALIIAAGSVIPAFLPKGSAPESADMAAPLAPETVESGNGADAPGGVEMPHVTVNGEVYLISSHLSSYDECPASFEYGGELEGGDYDGCSYYTSGEYPHLVYVRAMSNNDGRVDSSGTVIPTEWHMAYLRFVTEEMRGRDFVCVDGQLYTSMWNGRGAVDEAFYDRIEREYGVRIEGDAPEGFVSRGNAAFAGWDIWPEGSLSSNTGEEEVYVNPDDPEIVLVATVWHTAQGRHQGFDVYLRCEK